MSARALLCLSLALPACGTAAHADWRDPIAGAPKILPSTFAAEDRPLTVHAGRGPAADESARWSAPLMDRVLPPAERAASLSFGLQEAILRIEPIYDPTRLDGPIDLAPFRISAGTAATRDLFGEHWRMASADPNVDERVDTIARAWSDPAPLPCERFTKHRAHDFGEAALTALDGLDCRLIRARQDEGWREARPVPIAIARPPLPVFAAPLPGSRLSSKDFWAQQKARITAIRAHLHRKWQGLQAARATGRAGG